MAHLMATIDLMIHHVTYLAMFDGPYPPAPKKTVATVWMLDEETGEVRHKTMTLNGARFPDGRG